MDGPLTTLLSGNCVFMPTCMTSCICGRHFRSQGRSHISCFCGSLGPHLSEGPQLAGCGLSVARVISSALASWAISGQIMDPILMQSHYIQGELILDACSGSHAHSAAHIWPRPRVSWFFIYEMMLKMGLLIRRKASCIDWNQSWSMQTHIHTHTHSYTQIHTVAWVKKSKS